MTAGLYVVYAGGVVHCPDCDFEVELYAPTYRMVEHQHLAHAPMAELNNVELYAAHEKGYISALMMEHELGRRRVARRQRGYVRAA